MHIIYTAQPLSRYCLKEAKRRERYGAQEKTMYGWAQRWGEYCHWRAVLSGGMLLENVGHKSPRKQTSLVPLLREQLVCLCNYCTCIYPSSHADAGLRVSLLFSIRTEVLCDLIILRKWSQTSKQLKTFWIRDLIIQIVCKILWKVLVVHERYVPGFALTTWASLLFLRPWIVEHIFLSRSNIAKITELISLATHLQPKKHI